MSLAPARTFETEMNDAFVRIEGLNVERINNARILMIGVGAIGNEVAKNLALYNVGEIYLCDMDTVEWANLSHSVLFRKEDDGRPKVEAAARSLHELNPRVKVVPLKMPLSDIGLGLWRNVDVILSGLDNRGSRLLIDRICAKVGKDWVDAGLGAPLKGGSGSPTAGLMQAAVQVFSPWQGYCYEYYFQTDTLLQRIEEEAASSRMAFRNWIGCAELQQELIQHDRVPTTPTMAALVGSMMAQEAIRQVCPEAWGATGIGYRRVAVDAGAFTFDIRAHPQGPAHPPLAPVLVAPELSARRTTVREIVDRAKRDLGPDAIVELGFQYCPGLYCNRCRQTDPRPFKVGSKSANCPSCSTPDHPMERSPLPGRPDRSFLDGTEEFPNLALFDLGVPLYDILTASLYERADNGRRELRNQVHYELAGDVPSFSAWEPSTT